MLVYKSTSRISRPLKVSQCRKEANVTIQCRKFTYASVNEFSTVQESSSTKLSPNSRMCVLFDVKQMCWSKPTKLKVPNSVQKEQQHSASHSCTTIIPLLYHFCGTMCSDCTTFVVQCAGTKWYNLLAQSTGTKWHTLLAQSGTICWHNVEQSAGTKWYNLLAHICICGTICWLFCQLFII